MKGFDRPRNEGVPLQHRLKNGDTVSPQQFTQLILDQRGIKSLTLFTMAYTFPVQDGNSMRIHQHLLSLADDGVPIRLGVDHTYANLFAAQGDWLKPIAPFVVDRRVLKI